jgi:CRP-like cAMP-binding protein
VELGIGPCRGASLTQHPGVRGRPFGVFVISGMLTGELEVLGRRCTRLHGPSDYVLFADGASGPLPSGWTLTVERPSRLALLDDRVLSAGARWPRISGRLYRAAAQQTHRAFLHQAIAQIPRIEDRLTALFWCLAERWGKVRADGVLIAAPLTHDALGRMVGAQRPTVTLGLRTLAERGIIIRQPDGWLLASDSLQALALAS